MTINRARLARLTGLTLALAHVSVIGACLRTPAPPPSQPPVPPGVPSTDIYLYRLSDGGVSLRSRVVNITNRVGYDNQPSFDGSAILYTSQRDGQTDVFKFENARHTAFTSTPESEYSPTLTPDGNAIAVVRVERDSTQRLWRFPLNGTPPTPILKSIKPVGYFAWLDSTTLALFVLGNPNTLRIADSHTDSALTVTTNIGRSLQRVPGGRRASFVQRSGDRWVLKTVDPTQESDGSWDIATVATLPDSAEYVVWKSDSELYTAGGSRLYRLRLPATAWDVVADLSGIGIRHITRLALHPNGRELALVADEVR